MNTIPKLLCACALAVVACAVGASTQSPAGRALGQLGDLVGAWEGKPADGSMQRVSYRWSAGNAVLVETWTLAEGREALTIYHRDGEALLATHYDPQFTHPRLFLVDQADDQLTFAFRDGANLQDPARHHLHAFTIHFVDANTFERSETQVANGAGADAIAAAKPAPATTFERVGK